eukprot:986476-Pyramimonas_sp.AAC.1
MGGEMAVPCAAGGILTDTEDTEGSEWIQQPTRFRFRTGEPCICRVRTQAKFVHPRERDLLLVWASRYSANLTILSCRGTGA